MQAAILKQQRVVLFRLVTARMSPSLLSLPQVYYFTKGSLKSANKQYSAVKNDYELTFTSETSTIPCDDAQHLPSIQFNFVSIGDLENIDKDKVVGESGRRGAFEPWVGQGVRKHLPWHLIGSADNKCLILLFVAKKLAASHSHSKIYPSTINDLSYLAWGCLLEFNPLHFDRPVLVRYLWDNR